MQFQRGVRLVDTKRVLELRIDRCGQSSIRRGLVRAGDFKLPLGDGLGIGSELGIEHASRDFLQIAAHGNVDRDALQTTGDGSKAHISACGHGHGGGRSAQQRLVARQVTSNGHACGLHRKRQLAILRHHGAAAVAKEGADVVALDLIPLQRGECHITDQNGIGCASGDCIRAFGCFHFGEDHCLIDKNRIGHFQNLLRLNG